MWSVAHGTPAMGKAHSDAELMNLQGCQHSRSNLNVLFRGWPLKHTDRDLERDPPVGQPPEEAACFCGMIF